MMPHARPWPMMGAALFWFVQLGFDTMHTHDMARLIKQTCSCLTAAAALVAAHLVAAQDTVHLRPDSFTPVRGGEVGLSLVSFTDTGDEEDTSPLPRQDLVWPADQVAWFFFRHVKGQTNQDIVEPRDEEKKLVSISLEEIGPMMIGVDFQPRTEKIAREKFERFVRDRLGTVLADSQLEPDDSVCIERLMSAKTLINVAPSAEVGAPLGQHGLRTSLAGQRAEIRPLIDPTALGGRGDVVYEFQLDTYSAAGARVTATHPASGTIITVTVAESGLCTVTYDRAGVWFTEIHILQPLAAGDSPDGPDFCLMSASLSFEIPESDTPDDNSRTNDSDDRS